MYDFLVLDTFFELLSFGVGAGPAEDEEISEADDDELDAKEDASLTLLCTALFTPFSACFCFLLVSLLFRSLEEGVSELFP